MDVGHVDDRVGDLLLQVDPGPMRGTRSLLERRDGRLDVVRVDEAFRRRPTCLHLSAHDVGPPPGWGRDRLGDSAHLQWIGEDHAVASRLNRVAGGRDDLTITEVKNWRPGIAEEGRSSYQGHVVFIRRAGPTEDADRAGEEGAGSQLDLERHAKAGVVGAERKITILGSIVRWRRRGRGLHFAFVGNPVVVEVRTSSGGDVALVGDAIEIAVLAGALGNVHIVRDAVVVAVARRGDGPDFDVVDIPAAVVIQAICWPHGPPKIDLGLVVRDAGNVNS